MISALAGVVGNVSSAIPLSPGGLGIGEAVFAKVCLELGSAFAPYSTIYLAPWYRMLGARLGKNAEISTASFISPDLLEIGDDGFIADCVSLGAGHVEGNQLTIADTKIGKRTFIGNSAILPAGSVIMVAGPPKRVAPKVPSHLERLLILFRFSAWVRLAPSYQGAPMVSACCRARLQRCLATIGGSGKRSLRELAPLEVHLTFACRGGCSCGQFCRATSDAQ